MPLSGRRIWYRNPIWNDIFAGQSGMDSGRVLVRPANAGCDAETGSAIRPRCLRFELEVVEPGVRKAEPSLTNSESSDHLRLWGVCHPLGISALSSGVSHHAETSQLNATIGRCPGVSDTRTSDTGRATTRVSPSVAAAAYRITLARAMDAADATAYAFANNAPARRSQVQIGCPCTIAKWPRMRFSWPQCPVNSSHARGEMCWAVQRVELPAARGGRPWTMTIRPTTTPPVEAARRYQRSDVLT